MKLKKHEWLSITKKGLVKAFKRWNEHAEKNPELFGKVDSSKSTAKQQVKAFLMYLEKY